MTTNEPASPSLDILALALESPVYWRFEKPRIVNSTPTLMIDWVIRRRHSVFFCPFGVWRNFENADGDRATVYFMPVDGVLRNPDMEGQPPPDGWNTETLVVRGRILIGKFGKKEMWYPPWDFAVYSASLISIGPTPRCEVSLTIDSRFDMVVGAMKQNGWRPLPGANGVTADAEESEEAREAATMTASHAFYWEFYRAVDRDFPEGKPDFRAYELMPSAGAVPADAPSTDQPDRAANGVPVLYSRAEVHRHGYRVGEARYERWQLEVALRYEQVLTYERIAEQVQRDISVVMEDFELMREFANLPDDREASKTPTKTPTTT